MVNVGSLRARVALVALVVMGTLVGGEGVAFGVSALSTDLDASSAQYGQVTAQSTCPPVSRSAARAARVCPASTEGVSTPDQPLPPGSKPTVLERLQPVNVAQGAGPAEAVATQAARQLDVSTGERLPFTGLSVIPVMLIGLGLLGWGLVLRRRTSNAGAPVPS